MNNWDRTIKSEEDIEKAEALIKHCCLSGYQSIPDYDILLKKLRLDINNYKNKIRNVNN